MEKKIIVLGLGPHDPTLGKRMANEQDKHLVVNVSGSACPKCGCQIYSPFGDGKLIHDVNSCGGLVKTVQSRPIVSEINAIISVYFVAEDKEFKFKGLCPYCNGDLTYRCNGWEQDEHGLWMADTFDVECSTEPDMDSEEWEDWMQPAH